jgi:hypothetical protein
MKATLPTRTKVIRTILIAMVLVLVVYLYAGSTAPAGQAPLVRLNGANLDSLKNEFNRSADSVRVLVLLSPT